MVGEAVIFSPIYWEVTQIAWARVRIREAKETGVRIIATACTLCAKMLTEALKAEGGDGPTVLGISEIMEQAGVERRVNE